MSEIVSYAEQYIKLGWSLCKFPRGTKGPVQQGWNHNPSLFIDSHEKIISSRLGEDSNIGLIHLPSGTAAFDADQLDWTIQLFNELGYDFSELTAGCPAYYGKPDRRKVLFAMPPGFEHLSVKKLQWPAPDANQKDPRHKRITVFELRAGANQDVLPPSIHPETKLPYEWILSPWETKCIPAINELFLRIWSEWDRFDPQLRAL